MNIRCGIDVNSLIGVGFVKTGMKVTVACALAYVIAYFVLMARNVPAVDEKGRVAFRSSFRMARTAGRLGPLTIEASEVTFLNYLFYPMDKLYYALAPASHSFNSLPQP